jgi:hypothetical protein
MSEQRVQEVADKARQDFRAFREGNDYLRSNDPGNAGWALLGYAEHQVELLDARLKRLGVDTAFGLDPVYLLADARPPVGDKQTIALMLTVFEAPRWFAAYYSGMRAIHIAVGEETLAMVLAAHQDLINSMAKKYLGMDKYPYHQPVDERVVVFVRSEHTTRMGA